MVGGCRSHSAIETSPHGNTIELDWIQNLDWLKKSAANAEVCRGFLIARFKLPLLRFGLRRLFVFLLVRFFLLFLLLLLLRLYFGRRRLMRRRRWRRRFGLRWWGVALFRARIYRRRILRWGGGGGRGPARLCHLLL